jgi:hypothetical protein
MADQETKPAYRSVKVIEFASRDEKADRLELEKALGLITATGELARPSTGHGQERRHRKD